MLFGQVPINLFDMEGKVRAATGEIASRTTTVIPSNSNVNIQSDYTIPPNFYQDAEFKNTNTLMLTDNTATDNGYTISKNTINIANNDYVWVFNYAASKNTTDAWGQNGGIAFSLHNDIAYNLTSRTDYGALGIYKNENNIGLKNTITVEFDNSTNDHYGNFD